MKSVIHYTCNHLLKSQLIINRVGALSLGMRVGGRGRTGRRAKDPDADPTGRESGASEVGRPREGAEVDLSASSSEVLARSSDAVRRRDSSSRARPKLVVPFCGLISSIIPPVVVVVNGARKFGES